MSSRGTRWLPPLRVTSSLRSAARASFRDRWAPLLSGEPTVLPVGAALLWSQNWENARQPPAARLPYVNLI
jgi:hypothetical protein